MTSDCQGKLDPSIVAECFHEHGESLRRFVSGLVRDTQLATDIVQTAFVRLAERGHEVDPGKRRAWLYRVAYNESMLQRRRHAMDDRALQRAVWSRETMVEAAVEDLVRGEMIERVREALRHLPPALQDVVRLRIYEEKTFAVIARELDIPLGTALGRMRSALQKMRQTLSDERED
ncbi:MAG: sigma-70 family RNA polymerase sigma factor [Planctomycetes bacterium]|nr:sigma-70 family RNA polymerase sigma factor [Planctomycetota bacterium]